MHTKKFEMDPWIVQYVIQQGIVDKIDAALIRELIFDSRQSTQQLANKIGVSRPTTHERIKKLRENKLHKLFGRCEYEYWTIAIPDWKISKRSRVV